MARVPAEALPSVWLPGWGMPPAAWAGLPAFGGGPCRLLDYRGCDSVEALRRAALAALPATPCRLCGWSLGAMLAIETAAAAPERVASLLLLGASTRFVHPDRRLGTPEPWLTRMRQRLEREPAKVLHEFRLGVARSETAADDAAAARLLAARVPATPWQPDELPALRAGLAYLADADLAATLAALPQPWVWIHGERDPICPVGGFLAERGRLAGPGRRWVLLPAAGHAPHWQEPWPAALAAALGTGGPACAGA